MDIAIKNLILWRHADAEVANFKPTESIEDDFVKVDLARALTPKGQAQAKQGATWLKKYLPKGTIVLSSPALRAMQTADALKMHMQIEDGIKPGAELQEILVYLSQADVESLIVVGHQPWLGQLIAHLLGFGDAQLSVKKGAIWWLRLSSKLPNQYKLLTIQTPEFL